jgi:hypothetical protein
MGLRDAGRFDGVSIEERGERRVVRIVLASFFEPKQPACVVKRIECRTGYADVPGID